jgi:hypothetical protein
MPEENRSWMERRLAVVDAVFGGVFLLVALFCGFAAVGLVDFGDPVGPVYRAVYAVEGVGLAYISGVYLCRALIGLTE